MVINQGDLFWVDLPEAKGSRPAYSHPCVVVQNDILNHSPIQTTIVCFLTSNLRRAKSPANVLLEEGESNLPKSSVVLVTQMLTVDKADLVNKIGSLSSHRLQQIIRGVHWILDTDPTFP
jgi:mRNA interferase MazF